MSAKSGLLLERT